MLYFSYVGKRNRYLVGRSNHQSLHSIHILSSRHLGNISNTRINIQAKIHKT